MSAMTESFWSTLPLGREVVLLSHDRNGLAALAKPAGVLSHPNAGGDEPRSLLTTRYQTEGEFYEWASVTPGGPPQRLWLLNRLDSATSGVILAASDEALANEIRAEFLKKKVRKVYVTLVFGTPKQSMELWSDFLAVDKRGGQIRTSARAGHVAAECKMSVVRAGRKEPRLTLLKLEPRTGRSHQLRVQCAKRHLHIVGDQTYGDFRRNREFAKAGATKRMFLHSSETSFDYEFREKKFSFSARAPLPPEFEKFL